MKLRLIVIVSLVGIALLISSAFLLRQPPRDTFLEKRAELVVRQIGHKLLRYSGDFTSRVLPVTQLSPGTFQLKFETPFSFMPDTLVKIARSNLDLIHLPVGYIVNVFDCTSKEMVYGFEIRPNQKELVPCLGRPQPEGCYTLLISFVDFQSSENLNNNYPLLISSFIGMSLIAFTGGYYLKRKKERDSSLIVDGVVIGKYSFSFELQLLKFNSEIIELSYKEAKLLSILAAQQNQVISREELLKKVWEDDGVFTGRSLDMFISKLRKKLSGDSNVQINNVHGKGYKLEIKTNLF